MRDVPDRSEHGHSSGFRSLPAQSKRCPSLEQIPFTGESISTAESERYGLIGEVVPEGTLAERVDDPSQKSGGIT